MNENQAYQPREEFFVLSEEHELRRSLEILASVAELERMRRAAGIPRPPLFPHLGGTHEQVNSVSAVMRGQDLEKAVEACRVVLRCLRIAACQSLHLCRCLVEVLEHGFHLRFVERLVVGSWQTVVEGVLDHVLNLRAALLGAFPHRA